MMFRKLAVMMALVPLVTSVSVYAQKKASRRRRS